MHFIRMHLQTINLIDIDIEDGRRKKIFLTNSINFPAISNLLNPTLELYKNADEPKVVNFSWRVKNFMQKISNCGEAGINSKNIKIKINDVTTTWNTSLR